VPVAKPVSWNATVPVEPVAWAGCVLYKLAKQESKIRLSRIYAEGLVIFIVTLRKTAKSSFLNIIILLCQSKLEIVNKSYTPQLRGH
jgi:hypothetical protein